MDNLGRDGWPGVSDYEGYKECCWFRNDAFWWNPNATDWAYSTPWWPEWHPKYAVVHRYASYIIDGLNHWLTGYIDWNAVLDSIGGPTHVNNCCGAMLMVDYSPVTGNPSPVTLYYTPYYYVKDGQRIAFVRNGEESIPATAEEMVRLVLKGSNKTYDSLHTDNKIEDNSFTILANTFKERTSQDWDNAG